VTIAQYVKSEQKVTCTVCDVICAQKIFKFFENSMWLDKCAHFHDVICAHCAHGFYTLQLRHKIIKTINKISLPSDIVNCSCPKSGDSAHKEPCQNSVFFSVLIPGPKYMLLNSDGLLRVYQIMSLIES